MSKNKKKGRNPLAVICSTLGTLALVALIAACVPLTIPRMLGYELYTVVSGSMEPAIPTGSLVYVENMDPTEVQEGDVIAFYSVQGGSAVITHRVVTNSTVMGEFITKGDANPVDDGILLTEGDIYGVYLGHIPGVGRIVNIIRTPVGIGFILAIVVLLFISDVRSQQKKSKDSNPPDEQ